MKTRYPSFCSFPLFGSQRERERDMGVGRQIQSIGHPPPKSIIKIVKLDPKGLGVVVPAQIGDQERTEKTR
jgi:hypothetical protein